MCENDRRSTALWEGSDLGGLPEQESERIYSDERLSQRLSKSFKVFDGSAKSFPSRVCHASCCLGGLGHSDNSGTDPKHPRKCRFCTKVLPDDAVVAR